MPHYVTNRGKLLLAQGEWDDGAAGVLYCGLLAGASVPVDIDTEAEIQDLNDVAALLAISGVDEPVGGWYSRQNLSRIAVTEDDTNNRAAASLTDPMWASATIGETIYGAFIAKEGGADSADQLVSVITFTPTATNGGNFTLDFTNIYHFV